MTLHSFRSFSPWRPAFGLLEVILVFTIVLGASAVVFSVFDSAHRRARVDEEVNLLRLESRAVLDVFGRSHDYTGLTTSKAIASKVVIPDAYVTSSTHAINAYGNSLQISPFGGASAAFKVCRSSTTACFVIASKVPQESCFDLVTALEGSFKKMSVNSQGITTDNQFDNDLILAACQAADPSIVKVYDH